MLGLYHGGLEDQDSNLLYELDEDRTPPESAVEKAKSLEVVVEYSNSLEALDGNANPPEVLEVDSISPRRYVVDSSANSGSDTAELLGEGEGSANCVLDADCPRASTADGTSLFALRVGQVKVVVLNAAAAPTVLLLPKISDVSFKLGPGGGIGNGDGSIITSSVPVWMVALPKGAALGLARAVSGSVDPAAAAAAATRISASVGAFGFGTNSGASPEELLAVAEPFVAKKSVPCASSVCNSRAPNTKTFMVFSR